MDRPQRAPLLVVDRVVKRFGGYTAVAGASFEVHPGEVVGLIGANGAGKTTLLHLLYGRHRADAGAVVFGGTDVTALTPRQHALAGMGLVFQKTSVFLGLSVEENLRLGALARVGSGSRADVRRAIDEMLDTVNLVAERYSPVAALSHGAQQWLEIGMALLARPKLLILDEPTSGMTRTESHRTAGLIRQLQADAPERSVIVVEHNIEFMGMVSDRVMVMHRGAVIADGTVAEVQATPAVQDAYLGRLR
jgi:ABC-type uncharacterized transport system ATPase subunit